MKMYAVIAYDIPDNKRRARVAKILEGYGQRMQYSLFECRITKVQYLPLRARLEEIIEPEDDELSFYFLDEFDENRILRLGQRELFSSTAIFVGLDQIIDK
jgi:CRISPR-associated protein Cas2